MTLKTFAEDIGATQLSANTNVRNEAFYIERFKKSVTQYYKTNARIIDTDFHCEIYKGFAIVVWKQEWTTPATGRTRISYSNYVWECGGVFDSLPNLGWISQGCVTTGYGATTLSESLKKVKKRVDVLSLMYAHKTELQGLSQHYVNRISSNSSPVYNALVGDVVAISAFGRTRLGKIVKTTGNRFIVAYMTPSNPHDVHYKTLPLSSIYPKD